MPCMLPLTWPRADKLPPHPPEHMDEAPPPPSPGHEPPKLPEEVALEFRPEVKIAAAVLLVLAWVCVLFVSYRLGRQTGYSEGLSSDMVARQVNEEAVRNIAYFLQVASADDATLLDTVLQHEERLEWVKDPIVRREALGMLLGVLMDRGLMLKAEAVLDEVMPPKTTDAPAWITRMQKAARCFAMAGRWEKAQAYYDSVVHSWLRAGDDAALAEALREHALMLCLGCGTSAEDRLEALRQIGAMQDKMLPGREHLSVEVITMIGRTLREQGKHAEAEKAFRHALERAAELGDSHPATSTLACCGVAHLELQQRENAEKYLKASLERGETSAPQRLAQIMALQNLTTLALNDNRIREALDLINRAREMAALCLPQGCAFWLTLAEQRGWAFFMLREYEASLAEFHGVLQAAGEDAPKRMNPLEGIARNCLALGRVEEALPAAEECVKLHEQFSPEAPESLGRALLLLGQACDQAGHAERAAEAYGRAAAALPEGHAGRVMALVSQAYSLMQAQAWEPAVQVWEAALPLLSADDAAFRERAVAQLADCRKKAAGTPEPAPSSPKPRRTKTSRRTR